MGKSRSQESAEAGLGSSALFRWFDERIDLSYFTKLALKKEVPVHRFSIAYFLGGIVMFLLMIQLGSGILLLLYYRPSAEEAFESVQFIVSEVEFGWLIRSLHSWSANLLVGFAFLHMFSTFFMKAYRRPRELTWITGVLLFYLMLGFGFSGYLLPWNELAYFATQVGTDVLGAIPLVGGALAVFFRGGEQVTGATLTRFFGFHVAVLPALTTILILFHISLVQKHGMSVPPRLQSKNLRTLPFFPGAFLRDLAAWYVVLGLLVFLCVYSPWELGSKADPFAPAPVGIQPEWYFLFMFETLKFLPSHILAFEGEVVGIMAFSLGGLLWLLVPFWDSFLVKRGWTFLVDIIGGALILYILGLTLYAVW